jgi:arginine decarboxylase
MRWGEVALLPVHRVLHRWPRQQTDAPVIASPLAAPAAGAKTLQLLSEHHAWSDRGGRRGFAEDMAASSRPRSVWGSANANWDEKEQVFKISGEIVRTFNVTQSAVISSKGWTTVVAAGVFIF